jgi:hypothetical protein
MPNGGRQNEKRKQQTGRKRIKQRRPDWFWCRYQRWQVYMKYQLIDDEAFLRIL